MIKAIIIEEDASIREHLRTLISELDDEVIVVAECDSLKKAEETIEDVEPELLFLDVDLPGGSGFDLLDRIPPNLCEAVFITAHECYAVKALKYAAVVYVL